MMDCKKCGNPGTLVIRKKDYYCESCFIYNTNHKFRACIGKKKILSTNEKVLVCLSAGQGSTVLLDLIYNGLAMDINKKLRIIPFFLHITDDDNSTQSQHVIELCRQFNFNVYVIHISEYFSENNKLPEVNSLPFTNNDLKVQLTTMLNNMPPTSSNDLLPKIRQELYTRTAKLLECNFIFTAETTTTLAMNLLSNLAMGRGSQVENNIGFCDSRDKRVKILRPLRDISKEELYHYISIKQFVHIYQNNFKDNSLQSVIATFVADLQESFQATISTVCKTADKIGVHDAQDDKETQCKICKSDLNKKHFRLSALEATNFSRTVSNSKPQECSHDGSMDYLDILQGNDVDKMFPHMYKHLCYGCSRNYTEMTKCQLPNYIQKFL